jgi:hypothetical protein
MRWQGRTLVFTSLMPIPDNYAHQDAALAVNVAVAIAQMAMGEEAPHGFGVKLRFFEGTCYDVYVDSDTNPEFVGEFISGLKRAGIVGHVVLDGPVQEGRLLKWTVIPRESLN